MNKIETTKNKLNISAILFTYGVPINEAKQIGDFILKLEHQIESQQQTLKQIKDIFTNIPSDNTTCDTKIINDIEKIIYEVEEWLKILF